MRFSFPPILIEINYNISGASAYWQNLPLIICSEFLITEWFLKMRVFFTSSSLRFFTFSMHSLVFTTYSFLRKNIVRRESIYLFTFRSFRVFIRHYSDIHFIFSLSVPHSILSHFHFLPAFHNISFYIIFYFEKKSVLLVSVFL